METDIALKEQEFSSSALTLKETATSITVSNQNEYESATIAMKQIKEGAGKITDFFKPLKEAAHAAHKAITSKEAEVLAPLKEADLIIRAKMSDYLTEQERIRKAEEIRLQAIADEEARKGRERLLKQATKAEEKGNVEKADDLLQKAEDVYAAPVTVASTTTGGARELCVTVTNIGLFISALIDDEVPAQVLADLFDVRAVKLKNWVRATGKERYPGLHIENKISARIR